MRSAPIPPHRPLERYYRTADQADRRAFVTSLFDRTAPHYDWLDRIMSFGSGLRYREQALERAGLTPGMRVLDVAVGTGLTARAALNGSGCAVSVMGVDASSGMLRQARAAGTSMPLVRGLAESLPLANDSFDFLTMGYALRHVADLKATFREYHRILRPGGRLVILELTRPPGGGVRDAMTRLYLKRVLPLLAQIGPGGSEARRLMEYYWDTIAASVEPETVLAALREARFRDVDRSVVLDVFSEYRARRSD